MKDTLTRFDEPGPDGFSFRERLAAQLLAGIMANSEIMKDIMSAAGLKEKERGQESYAARMALDYAQELILKLQDRPWEVRGGKP